jgi:hypothetical protein
VLHVGDTVAPTFLAVAMAVRLIDVLQGMVA